MYIYRHVCIHFYEYFSLLCNFWCLRAKFLLIILTCAKRLQSISRGPEVLNIAIYHLDNDKEFSSSVFLLDFCLLNARSASLWFCSAVLAPRCQWSPCFQLSESLRALEKNPCLWNNSGDLLFRSLIFKEVTCLMLKWYSPFTKISYAQCHPGKCSSIFPLCIWMGLDLPKKVKE